MSYDATLEVWLGSDNIEELVLVNGEPLTNLSSITRAVFCIGGDHADSDLDTGEIWWTDSVSAKELPDGTSFTGNVLRARLGRTTITEGDYSNCRVVVFSEDYPSGLVVSDNLRVIVHPEC